MSKKELNDRLRKETEASEKRAQKKKPPEKRYASVA